MARDDQKMMLINREIQINSILFQRRPLAEQTERVQAHLRSLFVALSKLKELQADITGRKPDLGQTLAGLDFDPLKEAIQGHLATLEKLKRRFARNGLNIGVIGRARQGKSLLLQSLTGLTSAEIPTGSLLHCTGVCSIVQHEPQVPTYAEVTCYSEQEFLDEVIAPYYHLLHLGDPPATLSEFATEPLPLHPPQPFDATLRQEYGPANLLEKYRHLRHYQEQLPTYRHLLQPPTTRAINPKDFRLYVAQYTETGAPIFNYMAVRVARIGCTFPHPDIGAIAVVDMPGLGDTGIGDQARLIQMLGDLVDIVLFVKKPVPGGDFIGDVDVQLYDTARRALPTLPIERWSLLVLNKISPLAGLGDNAELCAKLQATLPRSLAFVDSVIVDCANPDDVRHQVLDRVLAYLVDHIRDLDRQFAVACQEELLQLRQQVQLLLEQASHALHVAVPRGGSSAIFRQHFDQLWQELTRELEHFIRQLHDLRKVESTILQQAIENALWLCKTQNIMPTLQEIQDRRDLEGSYTIAYHQFLHDIRTRLTRRLMSLDPALNEFVNEIKAGVASVLIEHGRLGLVVPATGAPFLEAMAERIPADLPELKQAFEQIAAFRLSYRGFLHYRIRSHLDRLTPDAPNSQLKEIMSATDVREHLELFYGETIARVEHALQELLATPNEAAFAAVEEFVDQILRARNAARRWEGFYDEVKLQVWPEIFGELTETLRIQEEWQAAVKRAFQSTSADYRLVP